MYVAIQLTRVKTVYVYIFTQTHYGNIRSIPILSMVEEIDEFEGFGLTNFHFIVVVWGCFFPQAFEGLQICSHQITILYILSEYIYKD